MVISNFFNLIKEIESQQETEQELDPEDILQDVITKHLSLQ
jgi:hypothetical protein